MADLRLPLEGIRIIDLTIVWAGPSGSIFLGDLGAELIRVESLQHPDVNTRGQTRIPRAALDAAAGGQFPNKDPGPRPWERSAGFQYTGRNKISMTVDLERPSGIEIFLKLVQKSDVIFTNYAAGTLEKLKLTYPVIQKANPRIIMVYFPGFGLSGPYKYYKGFGTNMEAESGLTALRGYADMDLTANGAVFQADAAAGAMGAYLVLMALHYRNRTGQGQFIEMSQAETTLHHLSQAWFEYAMNGRVLERMGNRDLHHAPQGVYRCRGEDNWVAITIQGDEMWQRFCGAIGRPELAEDPRYADVVNRYKNQDDLDPIIAAWTADKGHYEVMRLLQGQEITAGTVISHREIFDDPHLQARGFFKQQELPGVGAFPHPGPVYKMSKTPLKEPRRAPTLGEHNEYVYKTVLGYSDQEYEQLKRDQQVGDTYVELLPAAQAQKVAS
ncbi:MAG: CoA transferase [Chloroflexi bacterium]|nr:CoA transferase [Chloroflexota bacterium]